MSNEKWVGPTKAAEEMHPDLKWIAENVSEWPLDVDGYIQKTLGGRLCSSNKSMLSSNRNIFSKVQWLQARKDLGLIMSDDEESMPAEDWAGKITDTPEEAAMVEDMVMHSWVKNVKEDRSDYSPYFKDVRHIDTIDVYRVVSLFDCEKHGHPISHAAKKLLLSGARTGGKDVEHDVREAIDSLQRWLEMREEDRNAM